MSSVRRAARDAPARVEARRAAMLDIPGLDVQRKEFGVEATFFHPFDTRAIRSGRSSAEVIVIVGHWRGDVIVRVNDNRTPLNSQGPLP